MHLEVGALKIVAEPWRARGLLIDDQWLERSSAPCCGTELRLLRWQTAAGYADQAKSQGNQRRLHDDICCWESDTFKRCSGRVEHAMLRQQLPRPARVIDRTFCTCLKGRYKLVPPKRSPCLHEAACRAATGWQLCRALCASPHALSPTNMCGRYSDCLHGDFTCDVQQVYVADPEGKCT